jgi:hypothetical protein
MISGAELGLACFAAVALGIGGALWIVLGIRDPYESIGGGPWALDVSDRVPPPPLDSPAGRAEYEQLVAAVTAARRSRRHRKGA